METVITSQGRSFTKELIEDWLIKNISEELSIPLEEVDVTKPFSSYELDSVTMIGLSGELESFIGLKINPTATYEYPTIEKLSTYLLMLLKKSL